MAGEKLLKDMLEELKNLLKSETIFGEPITVNNNITIIPISKISFAFGAGGYENDSEKENKIKKETTGTGGGASIEPLGFIVINNGDIQLLKMKEKESLDFSEIISSIVKVAEKVKGMGHKNKSSDNEEKKNDEENKK